MIVARPRGLGFDYYDLKAAAGLENCSPMDSACVSRNLQKSNAVEDLWASKYMTDPNTANLPVPNITVTTNPQQAADFAAAASAALPAGNNPQTGGVITVNGQSYSDVGLEQSQGWATPYTRAASSAPAKVVNSSGGQSAPLTFDAAAAVQSAQNAASGVPWYVWAGGAAALFFVFRGGR